MIRNLLILGVLLAVLFAGTWIADKSHISQNETHIPQTAFNGLMGETVSLHENGDDRITLLHFWATWCAPCLAEIPDLFSLAESNKDRVRIIAVAMMDTQEDIERFLETNDIAKPANVNIVIDPEGNITQQKFNVLRLPETIILSSEGQITDRIIGAYEDWQSYPLPDTLKGR